MTDSERMAFTRCAPGSVLSSASRAEASRTYLLNLGSEGKWCEGISPPQEDLKRRGKGWRAVLSDLFDLQVVGDVECQHIGAHLCFSDLLVHRVRDHAFQRHLSVLHDNVNRWIRLNRVRCEHRVAIDGSRGGPADLIIKSREWQHAQ